MLGVFEGFNIPSCNCGGLFSALEDEERIEQEPVLVASHLVSNKSDVCLLAEFLQVMKLFSLTDVIVWQAVIPDKRVSKILDDEGPVCPKLDPLELV